MDLLLVANSKYLVQVLALLYSLFEYNSGKITIHLFYSDLKSKEVNLISHFIEKWGCNKQLILYYVNRNDANGMKTTQNYPEEIYYRIFAINMLPQDIDKILYLDVDMIIKGSLEELYETDLEGYAFAACEDIYGTLMGIENSRLEALEIATTYHYVNSGMLLLNLKCLREDCAVEKLVTYIKGMGNDISFPDQDALNVLYYNKTKYVPWEKYNCVPMTYVIDEKSGKFLTCADVNSLIYNKGIDFLESVSLTQYYYDNAVIVHYAGTRKPWVENQGDPGAVEIFEKAFWLFVDKAERFLTKERRV